MFGYGSLVSPMSFGATLRRDLRAGVDMVEAEIVDYGRRWNYGVMHTPGWTDEADGPKRWTIVALGVVPSAGESINGVVVRVGDDELARLDHRERNYDRVDVTGLATVRAEVRIDAPIVTYVPRPEARERYAAARDRGEAAIEQRYWDLVDGAFAALGDRQRARYHDTTPDPDIPVVALRRGP